MKLSGIGINNTFFNSAVINQKVNRTKSLEEEQGNSAIQWNNRDSVFISKQGKQNNMIQQLMDQKKLIQECKDAEMKRGMEGGYVDQEKLDEYDEQLKMLDQKIAETTAEQSVNGEGGKNTEQTEEKVLTKEEYEKSKFMDMMNITSGIEQSEVILAAKGKMEGEARVLKAEIKSDGGRASESKLERVAEIEAKTADLVEQAGEKVADMNEIVSKPEEAEERDVIEALYDDVQTVQE